MATIVILLILLQTKTRVPIHNIKYLHTYDKLNIL